MMGVDKAAKKSDLGVRTASAVVMLAFAALAFWERGWLFGLFVLGIALALMAEWIRLSVRLSPHLAVRGAWLVSGSIYIGVASLTLWLSWYGRGASASFVLPLLGAVVATDIGAYFAGRQIGGPKLAPRISPNKTWAGLIGGMLAAGLWLILVAAFQREAGAVGPVRSWLMMLAIGAAVAVVAQSGDLLESWMKRRAGVKDSGSIIPGHGGILDRLDGMVAVFFVFGLIEWKSIVLRLVLLPDLPLGGMVIG